LSSWLIERNALPVQEHLYNGRDPFLLKVRQRAEFINGPATVDGSIETTCLFIGNGNGSGEWVARRVLDPMRNQLKENSRGTPLKWWR
jgi:hypothetical protein